MYLACESCGDVLYYTKEDFDNDTEGGLVYFRDEDDKVHHFCTPHCLGNYVKDNYTRKHSLNGGESGAWLKRCL